jgi:hypothetical protein
MSTKNEGMKQIAEDSGKIQNNDDISNLPPVNVSETKENQNEQEYDNGTTAVGMGIDTSPPVEISPRRLTCYFKTEDGNGEMIPDVSNITEKVFFLQEEGKKSSFLLEPDKDKESSNSFYTVQKPANIVIEHTNGTFFLGGFQIVSTAKSVEIYLTDKEGKETYLTTSKAISFNKEDTTAPWHKGMF